MSAHAIGRYTVLRELGAGGMGEIYLARDPGLDRHVALKLLRDKLADDPEVRERFRREARALAALSHPGIVTIYEIGHDAGRDFIAMEYLAGHTLRKALHDDTGSSSWRLIVATRTAIAVAAAHRAGVLHRDIKPENIMITDDSTVKVVDFGLAQRLQDGASGPEDTGRLELMFETTMRLDARGKPGRVDQETNTIFGTPGYMAPEILRGAPANEAGDVYALGVVVFETVAGRLPYSAQTFTATLAQILDGGAPPPRLDDIAGCSPGLADTVARMLAHAPDERPTMEEAAQALAEAAAEAQAGELASEHGVTTGDRLSPYGLVATERVVRRSRRAPLVAGLAAAVSAAAAVIVVLVSGSSAPISQPPPGSLVVAVGPVDLEGSGLHSSGFKGTGVPVLLGSLLGKVPAIRVVSTDRIVSAIGTSGRAGAWRRAAGELGAMFFVSGHLNEQDGRLQADFELVDLTDPERALATSTHTGDLRDLGDVLASVADDLAAGLTPSPDPVSRLESSAAAMDQFQRGIDALMGARYSAACVHLEQAVAEQPEFFEAWYFLGLASAWTARPPEQTIAAAERAAELAQSKRDRQLMLALATFTRHDYGRAIAILEPLAEAHPRDRDVLYLLGEALYHDGQLDRGVALLDRVLEVAPKFYLASIHPQLLATARGSEQSARFYARFHEDRRWQTRSSARLDFAMGRYDEVAAAARRTHLGVGALSVLGRDRDAWRRAKAAQAAEKWSITAELFVRAKAHGHGADTYFDELSNAVRESRNPLKDEWLLKRVGSILVIAGQTQRLKHWLGLWEDRDDLPFRTDTERFLDVHAAPIIGDRALLDIDEPTTRESAMIRAIRAEMDAHRRLAVKRWREILASPGETGDYLTKFALARNLHALGEDDELAKLCREMMRPRVYQPAYVPFRNQCRDWGALDEAP